MTFSVSKILFASGLLIAGLFVFLLLSSRNPTMKRNSRARSPDHERRTEKELVPRSLKRAFPSESDPRVVPQEQEQKQEPEHPADESTDQKVRANLEAEFEMGGKPAPEIMAHEARFREAMVAKEVKATTLLEASECRGRICRATLVSDNVDSLNGAISRIFLDPATEIENELGLVLMIPETHIRDDGSVRAKLYLVPQELTAALTH